MAQAPVTDATPSRSFPDAETALRRELYFFALYRVLEASLLALMLFSPVGALIGQPRDVPLGRAVVPVYLLLALGLLLLQRQRQPLQAQVLAGIAIDIAAAALSTHALPSAAPGIALMLLFNLSAAALLLPLRLGLGMAAVAAAALIGEFIWMRLGSGAASRPLAELLMFATSYMAVATLTSQLGRQMRASHALAEKRGAEVDSLAEINELIIRRMRTGVLLVDAHGGVRMANEAALSVLADIDSGDRILALAAPELARRLQQWRDTGSSDETPLRLGSEQAEVLPRFARLLADDAVVLVFLDDASMVARRAESLTLATLGRFSASLAHEIRNPLAAINYATQLLEESRDIAPADRRLLQIIHQQCQRTNGIVESVLGMARRERANPEHVELVGFVRRFVDDYRQALPEETGSLKADADLGVVAALIDPRHLQQILTALVHNALHYGRLPGTARA